MPTRCSPTLPLTEREGRSYLTTFTNHIEILNRCKTIEQRIFYILYAYRERLKNRELQRCIVNDTFGSLMGNKKNFSAGLKTDVSTISVIDKR